MSSANRKLVMVGPAILIVPSCSSSTSDLIVSRNMTNVAAKHIRESSEEVCDRSTGKNVGGLNVCAWNTMKLK